MYHFYNHCEKSGVKRDVHEGIAKQPGHFAGRLAWVVYGCVDACCYYNFANCVVVEAFV